MKKHAGVAVRSKQVSESELRITIKVPEGVQMRVFIEAPEGVQLFQGIPKASKEEALKKLLLSPYSVLQLSERAKNVVRNADIYLVGELALRDRSLALKYAPNFIGGGKKSLDEIEAALKAKGLGFAMSLSRELRDAIAEERAAIEREIEAKHARELRQDERLEEKYPD